MGNDITKEVDRIIDESIKDFLAAVNSIADDGPFRKSRTLPSAFGILEPANKSFYEYAYFERSLEWYIREILINQSLMELFHIHKKLHLNNVDCLWPEKRLEVRFSNKAIEDIYPFEFIVIQGKEKIGYRYTRLCNGDISELIEKHVLSRIKRISWDNDRKYKDSEDSRYETTSLADVFNEYFPSVNYDVVFQKMKKAVEEANADIGFETIPRLSLRYLSNFKVEVNEYLSHKSYDKIHFQILSDSLGSNNKQNLGEKEFDESDYVILNNNFVKNGLYSALLGTEGFAKCFITAEYQYQVFKQGHSFDYTSVACGYLKAVEQLIYKLIRINLSHPQQEKLWILKNGTKIPKSKYIKDVTVRHNPATEKYQVVFDKDFEEYFNITLSPMIWFLHDNVNGWEISETGREIVHSFLLSFAQDCRNDHFHKDNIDEFSVVTRIRNNTILIAYLLLGGYKLSGSHQKDYELLGIIDDSFGRLFRKIQMLPRGMIKFIICFEDKEAIKAYRHFTQEQTVYDENGSVVASRIKFVEVDKFDGDEYDNAMQGKYTAKEFYISQSNMPTRISYTNGRNEEILITW